MSVVVDQRKYLPAPEDVPDFRLMPFVVRQRVRRLYRATIEAAAAMHVAQPKRHMLSLAALDRTESSLPNGNLRAASKSVSLIVCVAVTASLQRVLAAFNRAESGRLGLHREGSFLGVMGQGVCAPLPFYSTSGVAS